MVKLRNKTIEVIAKEGRISHLPLKEEHKIFTKSHKRMTLYTIKLIKRTQASYNLARNLIYNS